jgi:hypothetical protein
MIDVPFLPCAPLRLHGIKTDERYTNIELSITGGRC